MSNNPKLSFILLVALSASGLSCKEIFRSAAPDKVVVGANQAVSEQLIVSQLRSLQRAERTYKNETGRYGSIDDLVDKGMLNRDPGGHLSYRFQITAAENGFQCVAVPSTYGPSGRLSFYMDETGAVHGADHEGGPASASDPLID